MTQPAFNHDPDRVNEWFTEWERTYAKRWLVDDEKRYRLHGPRPKFIRGPRTLPESNESVRTLRALEEQVRDHVPLKETE